MKECALISQYQTRFGVLCHGQSYDSNIFNLADNIFNDDIATTSVHRRMDYCNLR